MARRPRDQRATQRGQRGFTLLELLITLSVTTIGLIGLLSLHLSVARGNDTASRAAEAQQFAVSELESLRSMRLGDLMAALNNGNTAVVFPSDRTQDLSGRGNVPFQLVSLVEQLTSVSTSLIRIRVVARWAEEGGAVGANGGTLDHALALEVIKTMEETL